MLPGIRFDPQARRVGDALPRMDVAAFVGFATQGPLQLPVALDDAGAFAAVFGASPPLALEAGTGRPVRAHLAGAVRAFFDNGGRRCWVLRVAGPQAGANRFRLRGWRRARRSTAGWTLDDAVLAVARSAGSWSDTLVAGATPNSRPVRCDAVSGSRDEPRLVLRASPPPQAGELLCLDSGEGSASFWLPIARLETQADGRAVAVCTHGLHLSETRQVVGDVDPALLQAQTRVRIVSLDLRVEDRRDGSARRLDALGLVRGHPRDWCRLADDAALYAPRAQPGPYDAQRFPLAGGAAADDGFDLPVGLEAGAAGPEPDGRSALQRDGLQAFDAALFLDPDLADASRSTLLPRADALRYTALRPRALSGVHALLGALDSTVQDEISLLAVPDAVHRPWREQPGEAGGPLFSELDAPPAPVPAAPAPAFAACHPLRPAAPAWRLAGCRYRDRADGLELQWQQEAPAEGLRWRLEVAATLDFAAPDTVQLLPLSAASLRGTPGALRYLRVRAEAAGLASAWSRTLRVGIPVAPQVTIDTAAGTPALWPVHAALLRVAAARGDWLALLALPPDWREDEALQHARRLQALDAGEAAPSTGSFGALFHPWALVTDADRGLATLPPDGLAAALMARRALERGAWIAPANEALRGVVALTPLLLPARWEALEQGRVNVLRREPAAFVTLSECTLAAEDELVPVHVRRLLSLLRRLALRLGAEFVFEPNDLALRVSLQTRCEHVLERLFRAGAFAGRRPEESFVVAVRAGADAAALVVELRLRPAAALRFITVRLVQAGADAAVTELL